MLEFSEKVDQHNDRGVYRSMSWCASPPPSGTPKMTNEDQGFCEVIFSGGVGTLEIFKKGHNKKAPLKSRAFLL